MHLSVSTVTLPFEAGVYACLTTPNTLRRFGWICSEFRPRYEKKIHESPRYWLWGKITVLARVWLQMKAVRRVDFQLMSTSIGWKNDEQLTAETKSLTTSFFEKQREPLAWNHDESSRPGWVLLTTDEKKLLPEGHKATFLWCKHARWEDSWALIHPKLTKKYSSRPGGMKREWK